MKAAEEADDADARLEEAAVALETMARELRRMKGKQGKTKLPTEVPSGNVGGIQAGQRVRIVRKDQYRGRTGIVLGRHGRLFWDVRLEANATHGACTIYKREASLCLAEAAE
jgi:hypothetical protein